MLRLLLSLAVLIIPLPALAALPEIAVTEEYTPVNGKSLAESLKPINDRLDKVEAKLKELDARCVCPASSAMSNCPECLAAGIGPDGKKLPPGTIIYGPNGPYVVQEAGGNCAGCNGTCPNGTCSVPRQCGNMGCGGGGCGQGGCGAPMTMRGGCGPGSCGSQGAPQGRRHIFPLFRRGSRGGCSGGSCGSCGS